MLQQICGIFQFIYCINKLSIYSRPNLDMEPQIWRTHWLCCKQLFLSIHVCFYSYLKTCLGKNQSSPTSSQDGKRMQHLSHVNLVNTLYIKQNAEEKTAPESSQSKYSYAIKVNTVINKILNSNKHCLWFIWHKQCSLYLWKPRNDGILKSFP